MPLFFEEKEKHNLGNSRRSFSLNGLKSLPLTFLGHLHKNDENMQTKSQKPEKKSKKKTETSKKAIKDIMVSCLFERKKNFARQIRDFDPENSPPEKKYYRNKNTEKVWHDTVLSHKTKADNLKKKEIEEKKNKLKKYEKMKLKKKR